MHVTIRNAALVIALLVSFNSASYSKTFKIVVLDIPVKSFISSCQKAGGKSSGGSGVVTCTSGNTETSCQVSEGRTEVCTQSTPSRQNPNGGRNSGAGNGNAGNNTAGDKGGTKGNTASSSGNANVGGNSVNAGSGNTIN